MNKDVALNLARRAINNLIASSHLKDPSPWRDARQDAVDALTAINEALAQPEQPQPAQRKPLTDEQINAIWNSLIASPDYSREMIARAIEAAHNIKEST